MPRLCYGAAICLESIWPLRQIVRGRAARKAADATWRFSGMLDAIFIAAGLAFFVVATLYTYACDRL